MSGFSANSANEGLNQELVPLFVYFMALNLCGPRTRIIFIRRVGLGGF